MITPGGAEADRKSHRDRSGPAPGSTPVTALFLALRGRVPSGASRRALEARSTSGAREVACGPLAPLEIYQRPWRACGPAWVVGAGAPGVFGPGPPGHSCHGKGSISDTKTTAYRR